jgi:hypothetical protein
MQLTDVESEPVPTKILITIIPLTLLIGFLKIPSIDQWPQKIQGESTWKYPLILYNHCNKEEMDTLKEVTDSLYGKKSLVLNALVSWIVKCDHTIFEEDHPHIRISLPTHV